MPTPDSRSPASPRERRRHPRVALDWPVTIALADGHHEARLRDLSRAGLCFFLDRRVPEMAILRVELALPGGNGDDGARAKLQFRGVVVRCQALSPHVDHYEIAVFFDDLDAATRRRLDDFLAERVT